MDDHGTTATAVGVDTEPLNVVADNRGSLDVIVQRLSGRFDRIMWDPDGDILCALAAVSDPDIRDGFRAARIVAKLDGIHQPVRWAADSPTVVCRAGCGAYPCATRDILDGR